MKTILFVNGCIRGEESRTLLLARRFLDCLRGKYEITEVSGLCLPLDREALEKRERLAVQGNWDDPVFDEAKRFMQADAVVLAAPFWEGTFPAAVFLASVFRMLGIQKTDTVTAEGLDIIGNDVRLIMNQALREAELLAGTF